MRVLLERGSLIVGVFSFVLAAATAKADNSPTGAYIWGTLGIGGAPTDAVFLLRYNFMGGERPPCLAACDANGDGQFRGQVTDSVYTLNFNFLGGPPPLAPFPCCNSSSLPGDIAQGCLAYNVNNCPPSPPCP